jgi:uncharacterized protein YgbK (DUF1537 family)
MSALKLAFYGDDFSGSTDVLEALAVHGVRAALFLELPERGRLERRFADLEAAGVAGSSRAMTPAEMDRELTPAFQALGRLGARKVHYKICSTFDSSPEIGSIGRAIEIGRRVFGPEPVPLVVGAPALRRWCVFGNLFAADGAGVSRLDRHSTMSRHPVTPMDESDLRRVLERQAPLRVALVDVLAVGGSREEFDRAVAAARAEGPQVVLFDVLEPAHLAPIGRFLWEAEGRFVAGSSGVEYALAAHWGRPRREFAGAGRADRILVVSGSCSPVTDRQIEWALAQGFLGVRVPGDAGVEGRVVDALRAGRSVVVYTARGPADPEIGDPRREGPKLGRRLGEIAGAAVREAGVRRLVAAGGDTGGRVARALGIEALEMAAPLAPGSPLCRTSSEDPRMDGLEIAFKGGQVGREDYFGRALMGGGSA